MNNFGLIRCGVFLSVLALCAAAERLLPRRTPVAPPGLRWGTNLALGVLGAMTGLVLPVSVVAAAYKAEAVQFGLLNRFNLYFPLKFVLSFLLLDFAIYLQHRLFHRVPALWRLHAVHHTDLDLDASSGVRFHPGEILLSAAFKIAAVVLLGTHFLAVAVFEIVLSAAALFNHANLNLGPLDAVLRLLVVTPDMHRVHHSPSREETDSNYGFNLPWWDRLLGTYRAQPREPHESMALGLDGARDPAALDLFSLIGRPFKKAL